MESDPDEVSTTVTPPPPGAGTPEPGRGGLLPVVGSPLTWLSLLAGLMVIGTGSLLLRRRRTGTHAAA